MHGWFEVDDVGGRNRRDPVKNASISIHLQHVQGLYYLCVCGTVGINSIPSDMDGIIPSIPLEMMSIPRVPHAATRKVTNSGGAAVVDDAGKAEAAATAASRCWAGYTCCTHSDQIRARTVHESCPVEVVTTF